jgi:hypothetical protein
MKRILIVGIIIIVGIFAGLKAVQWSIKNKYLQTIQILNSNDIYVKNEKISSGFFESNGSFEVIIKSDGLKAGMKAALGLDANEDIKDIELLVTNVIAHGIKNIFNGIEASGEVEVLNEPYKTNIKNIFNTNKPITFSVLGKNNGNKDVRILLKDIDLQKDDVKINVSDLALKLKLNGNRQVLNAGISNNVIKIFSGSTKIIVDNLNLDTSYKNPIEISNIMHNIVDTDNSFKLNDLHISIDGEDIDIKNWNDKTSCRVNDKFISCNLESSIGSINIDGTKFDSFKADVIVENIDKKAIKDLANNQPLNNDQSNQILFGILKSGLKIKYNDVSFKNIDGKNLRLKLQLEFDKIGELPVDIFSISMLNTLSRNLNLQGNIKLDTSPAKFFIPNQPQITDIADSIMIKNGIFIQNTNNYETNFYYNKRTQDIIFNDRISLQTVILSFLK